MIKIRCSIATDPEKGMQVRLDATGTAESPGEALYEGILRGAIQAALKVAGERYQALGLQALDGAAQMAKPDTPAPLGATAVEIPFDPRLAAAAVAGKAPPPCFRPVEAPKFSDFVNGLMDELRKELEAEKVKPEPNDEVIVSLQAAMELLRERTAEYVQRLGEYARAQAALKPRGDS
jgi:hypothetical protein